MLAKELSLKLQHSGVQCKTITLKITFANMHSITRSKTGKPTNQANDIYNTAAKLLDTIENDPIRLVGISLSHLDEGELRQLTLDDMTCSRQSENKKILSDELLSLQNKFGANIIKTGSELASEKSLSRKIAK